MFPDCTLYPTPQTPNPKHQTPNPKPQTLKPNPSTRADVGVAKVVITKVVESSRRAAMLKVGAAIAFTLRV